MNKRRFLIKGHVIDSQTKEGIPGLRVEAWDKDLIFNDLVGQSEQTDSEGYFEIEFDESYFREIFFDRYPDLFFRILRNSQVIRKRTNPLLRNVGKQQELQEGYQDVLTQNVTIEVDLTQEDETQPFTVTGWVRVATGTSLSGVLVRAFDKDLRREEQLGSETLTDAVGHYEILYIPANFSRAEQDQADLVVRAYDESGNVIAESAVLFNAGSAETVNLVVGGQTYLGLSEYERLVNALGPLLKGQGETQDQDLPISALKEDETQQDISFLSSETGWSRARISLLVQAHRLIQDTSIQAQIFYGFFRQNLPTDLRELLALNPEAQREALKAACHANIIPPDLESTIDSVIEQLKVLIVKYGFETTGEAGMTSLSALIGTILPDTGKQTAFLEAYVNHTGDINTFWQTMGDNNVFKDYVSALQFTLRLGALTNNHLPLVEKLQSDITSLKDLAQLDVGGWELIIAESGYPPGIPGADDDEKKHTYARILALLVEDAFPNEVLAYRIGADPSFPGQQDLHSFFANQVLNKEEGGFDFRSTLFDKYIIENPTALDGITDREILTFQIKAIQRLYKLAPRYEQFMALVRNGVHSAYSIVEMGSGAFFAKYTTVLGGPYAAREAFAKAQLIASTALHLMTEFGARYNSISLAALSGTMPKEVNDIPNWSTLFGSLDLCECAHCRSVYGPAAYFVDTLHFLNHRCVIEKIERDPKSQQIQSIEYKKTWVNGREVDKTFRHVLFERCPELGAIELTCENTNTPLPYIDLVNEILEDAVAPPALFQLPLALGPGDENTLDQRDTNNLPQELKSQLIQDARYAVINVKKKGEWWTIEDLPYSYNIVKAGDNLSVISQGRQTTGTAQELAANPQYVNEAAYDKLKTSIYPWTLPFDLRLEEARVYLRHLGISRHQMMETFLPGNRRSIIENLNVAAEYLALSSEEAELIEGITTSDPAAVEPGIWNLWGFGKANLDSQTAIPDPANSNAWISSGYWLEVLSERIDVFLQQSGLSYRELLELLDTWYLNPETAAGGRKLFVRSSDPDRPDTCETSKLKLESLDQTTALDEATASIIPRFVRLWRKLGWSMRDLDKVITGLDATNLDDLFLAQLSHVKRLEQMLDLPVPALLTFWEHPCSVFVNEWVVEDFEIPEALAGIVQYDVLSMGLSASRMLTLEERAMLLAVSPDPDFQIVANRLFHLQDMLSMDSDTYVDFDTPGYPQSPSLYAQLFRNKAITNPIDPAFTDNPGRLAGKLSEHVSTITAALGISSDDFQLLFNDSLVIGRIAKDNSDPDDRLTLNNLARLYRFSTLAKALGLPISELLSLTRLIGDPFASPMDAILFVERVYKMLASGFSVIELDYLFRHEFQSSAGVAPTDETIVLLFEEICSGLQTIRAEYQFIDGLDDKENATTDLNGELTRKKLALLDWDSGLIEQAVATFNAALVYEVALQNPMPADIQLENFTGTYEAGNLPLANFQVPPELSGVIDLNFDTKVLSATRDLTEEEKNTLLVINAEYEPAIHALFSQQPDPNGEYQITLEALPPARFIVPEELKGVIYLDIDNGKLIARRALTESEKAELENSNTVYPEYYQVIDTIFMLPAEFQGTIGYDQETQTLSFTGVMNNSRKARLKIDTTDTNYQEYNEAIDAFFEQPRTFISRNMRSFTIPDFAVSLEALPAGVKIPGDLAKKVHYDMLEKKLHCRGALSSLECQRLTSLSGEPDYLAALALLYNKPESVLHFVQTLAAFPTGLTIPEPLKDKVFFLADNGGELHCIGAMTSSEEQALLELSADEAYQASIKTLFEASQSADSFITPAEIYALFDVFFDNGGNPVTPATRFRRLLGKLMPKLRDLLSRRFVTQKISQALKLEIRITEAFLNEWLDSTDDQPQGTVRKCMEDFLSPAFADKHPDTAISRGAFPRQFDAFTRLHKVALIVTKFGITMRQLGWLADFGQEAGWLDLNALPVARVSDGFSLFQAWERVFDLVLLRNRLPLGESLLASLFEKAQASESDSPDELLALLSEGTHWNLDELHYLVIDHFSFFRNDFRDERALTRLLACFAMLRHLGMTARLCVDLSKNSVAAIESRTVVQAVKAHYGEEQWLDVAKPLRDQLREKQRSALVSHLLGHPISLRKTVDDITVEVPAWRNINDLFAYYLIDVEMSPCQMTSRIKQAIGSIQLFVQRCLMKLEHEALVNVEADPDWRQWEWRKNYRIWEANRKVFLYPENWIEPELRDDKTPFFKELESELLQSDLNQETSERAVQQYLEKLVAVANLEIVGMYHEVETLGGSPGDSRFLDRLHVFGRTRGTPHIYYYRQWIRLFVNNVQSEPAYWTAWERVDLDIDGDHLIPVILNKQLYLFWPLFTERAEQTSQEEIPDNSGSADGQNEGGTQGQGSNSGQSGGGGAGGDKFDNIKERSLILSGNELTVTSAPPIRYWEIQLAWSQYCKGKWSAKKISKDKLSHRPSPPEESSSGEVLLDIQGHEKQRFSFKTRLDGTQLAIDVFYEKVVGSEWWRFASCILDNANKSFKLNQYQVINKYGFPGPYKTITNSMFFSGSCDLYLPTEETRGVHVLSDLQSGFDLLTSHQDWWFTSKNPFFYQDEGRVFFVNPKDELVIWHDEENPPDIQIPNLQYPDYLYRLLNPGGPVMWGIVNLGDLVNSIISLPSREETGGAIQTAYNLAQQNRNMTEMANLSSFNGNSGITKLAYNPYPWNDAWNFWHYWLFSLPKFRVEKHYKFNAFYHPFAWLFVREFQRSGVDGLLQRPLQENPAQLSGLPAFEFNNVYHPVTEPTRVVSEDYPKEEIDFSEVGAYSQYNWELFFHIPLLIAYRLSANQRFAEAQRWFHYIFDPTDASDFQKPMGYWKTKPFYDKESEKEYYEQRIEWLLRMLAARGDVNKMTSEDQAVYNELLIQIRKWMENPFKPHLIARSRSTAYQKTVVMKYIDNLIAWGDQLFRRDTLESINEATQLYILAAEILGARPEDIPERAIPRVQTYATLDKPDRNPEDSILDEFSNALVEIERFVSPIAGQCVITGYLSGQVGVPSTPYFCVPKNEKLLGYWDTVADRLFKIRHCMNIEGIIRQLPLFEPPIEPGLLVAATAAGVDISSALNDINTPVPHYRFSVMAQKASELCAEVKALGSLMLSALEKRDAEEISLIRANQETSLLKFMEQTKQLMLKETQENLDALDAGRQIALHSWLHYGKLLGASNLPVPKVGDPIQEFQTSPLAKVVESDGIRMFAQEKVELDRIWEGKDEVDSASGWEQTAHVLYAIPNLSIVLAFMGDGFSTSFGGSNLGAGASAFASYFRNQSSYRGYESSMAGKLSQLVGRQLEWTLLVNQAAKEIQEIDKKIIAARTQLDVAQREFDTHQKQIENAQVNEEFLRSKFTSQELYGWMLGQLAGIYFQGYQLAYDIAKRAERAYRFELGLGDSNFIRFGYWDNLKKGLLAGDLMHQDIKRMETAYLDQNKREYEITRHISLSLLDPMALIELKQTGECFVTFPEALFDMDYPGHYLRRIKSVSLSIPCVTGPYTSVSCTLTLLKSSVRSKNTLYGAKNRYKRQANDPRFADYAGAVQSIVTSHAQNDSGLFETNLRDERYLPFEGSGVISEWRLQMPKDFTQFDYDSISDVILHIRYTAREGGGALGQQAATELQAAVNGMVLAAGKAGLARLFSLRHDFPTKWGLFFGVAGETGNQAVTLEINKEKFPFLFQAYSITIDSITVFIKVKAEYRETYNESALKLTMQAGETAQGPDAPQPDALEFSSWNGLLLAEKTFGSPPGKLTICGWLDDGSGPAPLDPNALEELSLLCRYTVG